MEFPKLSCTCIVTVAVLFLAAVASEEMAGSKDFVDIYDMLHPNATPIVISDEGDSAEKLKYNSNSTPEPARMTIQSDQAMAKAPEMRPVVNPGAAVRTAATEVPEKSTPQLGTSTKASTTTTMASTTTEVWPPTLATETNTAMPPSTTTGSATTSSGTTKKQETPAPGKGGASSNYASSSLMLVATIALWKLAAAYL